MSEIKIRMEKVQKIADILSPLPSEERQKIVQASLAILGEPFAKTPLKESVAEPEAQGAYATPFTGQRVKFWMKQNSVSQEHLEHVMHISGSNVELIITGMPGKVESEKVEAAYVLLGLVSMFKTNEPKFSDKDARALCENFDCYNSHHHSEYMRSKFFVGSKKTGWELTTLGLNRAGEIVKSLNGQGSNKK